MKKAVKKLLSSSLHSVKSTRWFVGSLLLMLTLTAASCVREQPNSPDKISDGEVSVTLNMDIPYSSSAQTRAIGATEENTIESVDVLAFEVDANGDEVFEYHSIAKTDAGHVAGVPKQAFTAKVRLKDYQQRFVIIANAKTQVEALLSNNWVGGLKDDMLKTLTVSLTNAGDQWNTANAGYTKFPMWGESAATVIKEGAISLGTAISMFRMIAKIDVRLNPTIQNASLFNEFKLKSVHLYNTSQSGRVTPSTADEDWDSTTTPGEPFAKKPSMPVGWTDANRIKGPLAYTDFGTPGAPDQSMMGAIYTFEMPTDLTTASKRPCLVVGGYYYDATTSSFDTDQTYYRLDFIKKDDGKFMPILRNHRYEFNIVNVKGRGYPTVDEAFKALPINMEVEVIKWNESGMNNGVSDGQYFLSVSKDEFNFFRDAQTVEGDDNILYVMTDYATTASGAKSGWYVDKIVDAADGTTVVNWLTLTPDKDFPNNKTKVVMSFGENTGADRAAIIWISAGRMSFAVKVTQTNISDIRVKIVDPATNEELTELLFSSAVGVAPISQQFRVDWVPKGADLTVNTTPIGTNAFPTGAGGAIIPALGNVTGGNNGTGTITYKVSPPALTAAEITGDPFMEKVSKVDFATTNGISYKSKSIFLRQINFNLLTDIAAEYFLTSQTETIKVRANFPWTITSVSDTNDILQNESRLTGKTGGNNTTLGDDLSFTMSPETSDGSKDGKTATITITNLIDKKTWTIKITAAEVLYVGYFGGKLIKGTDGVWQFERKLYVQGSDASTAIAWGPETLVGTGASSVWDGKGNTYNLRAADYPAANLCFTKNANHASITGVGDADYVWYLPAQNQLMAAWGAHASFSLPFGSASYWSATERFATLSWYVSFYNGYANTTNKTAIYRVRCVREVTP